jgi:hypothetical protein
MLRTFALGSQHGPPPAGMGISPPVTSTGEDTESLVEAQGEKSSGSVSLGGFVGNPEDIVCHHLAEIGYPQK